MLKKVEGWFFEKFAGKLVARAAVTFAAYVASAGVQGALGKAGIHGVQVDPAELTAGLIAAGHAAYEWYKAWRAKNSPAPVVPLPNA